MVYHNMARNFWCDVMIHHNKVRIHADPLIDRVVMGLESWRDAISISDQRSWTPVCTDLWAWSNQHSRSVYLWDSV